jgi:DNA polymerase-3 subunit delta'
VPTTTAADPWDAVVGQDRAAEHLRAAASAPVHAYLLVGQEGWGGRALARAFAADVLSVGLDEADAERLRHLVAAGGHADVATVEPEGNQLRKDEVDELIRLAHRQPTERPRKVLVLPRFDSAGPVAWSRMLKVLEEPPPTTIWILLADDLPAEMATIASRAVVVRLEPVPPALVAARLVAEGADAAAADVAAAAAAGDLGLARLLAGDARLALRVEGWRRIPEALDGTGHAVWRAVAERRAAIDDALAHVKAGFDAAEADLSARIDELHLPKGRLKELNDSHKRQLRRARTAEIRLGLAALAARYRDAVAGGHGRDDFAGAVAAIDATYEAIQVRNANEALQLQALLLKLPPLRTR